MLVEKGDLDGARNLFYEAAGVEPYCVEAIYNQGLVSLRLGEPQVRSHWQREAAGGCAMCRDKDCGRPKAEPGGHLGHKCQLHSWGEGGGGATPCGHTVVQWLHLYELRHATLCVAASCAQTALSAFRKLHAMLPDNYEVLWQIANCYDILGDLKQVGTAGSK